MLLTPMLKGLIGLPQGVPSKALVNAASKSFRTVQPQTSATGAYDIHVGVLLERKPVITQELTLVEKRYEDFIVKYENELSKKSDHEVRHENDKELLRLVKEGKIDQGTSQTAQDFLDASVNELKSFEPSSRTTDADKNDDKQSLSRSLDQYLFFLVQQKFGSDYVWSCPHGKWKPGETLRQTTERTIKEFLPDSETKVLGNAPWAIYKYKLPPGVTDEKGNTKFGVKVFFYKAQIQENTFNNTKSPLFKEFLWLKKDELKEKLQSRYFKTLANIMVTDNTT